MKLRIRTRLLTGLAIICSVKMDAQPTPIVNIGDSCSDIALKEILNFPKDHAQISDFKGKLLILDFWATWCSPCVTFFRETDSLQKQFEGQIQIMPVTYQDGNTVKDFLGKMKLTTGLFPPTVINDSVLQKIFPHNQIPHEVWIDSHGIVRAITSSLEVTAANINSFLRGEKISLLTKIDNEEKFEIDPVKPVFTELQKKNVVISDDDLLFHSIVTGFQSKLPNSAYLGTNFLNCLNVDIQMLYRLAYGDFKAEFMNSRVIVNIKDSALIDYPRSWYSDLPKFYHWQKSHMFCYELYTGNDTLLAKQRFKIMRADLDNYFGPAYGISAKLEMRKVMCWALLKTSPVDKLTSRGGQPGMKWDAFSMDIRNKKFINFISQLQGYFLQLSTIPLIDDTGYLGNVDMTLHCKMTDLGEINKEIAKYGLTFIKKEREIRMIVISQN